MKKKILFCFFAIIALHGVAETPLTFRLIHYKGNLQISRSSKPYKWEKISNDTVSLSASSFIRLDNNSEATLIGSNNTSFQLKKPGIIQLASLKSSKSANTSILGHYIKYLWSSFLHHEEPDLEKERIEYMETLGGVPRGTPCSLFYPLNGYLAGDTITFRWSNPQLLLQTFVVYADQEEEQLLYKKTINDSVLHLSEREYSLPKGKLSYWKIVDDKDYADCSLRHFVKVEDSIAQNIKKGAEELKKELTFSVAVNDLMMAYYYAEKGWSNEAVKWFNIAQKEEAGNVAILSSSGYFNEIMENK